MVLYDLRDLAHAVAAWEPCVLHGLRHLFGLELSDADAVQHLITTG